ncbi:hypothetical protein [Heyndrickxia acidiproducens]|uniref:hypothetical protein n=1 Tax=Heyndrickxia acidiproducens TaxID=1121084 RepID=UPI0003812A73|nr:hypothetical protein [Heyndrickxia acidiproducens]
MKRYQTLLLLTVFIILSISTFYTVAAHANKPNFLLKKISGNEKEVQDIKFPAYYQRDNQINYSLSITSAGSKYMGEGSLFTTPRPGEDEHPSWYRHNETQYPRFMRGKTDTLGFYEDKRIIAYVHSQYKGLKGFDIDILHKKSRKSETIRIKIPNLSERSYLSVWDVQKFGNQLKIVADANSGIHVYSILLPEKKLSGDDLIASRSDTGKYKVDPIPMSETTENVPSGIVAFHEEKVDNEGIAKTGDAYVYQLNTRKRQKLQLPKDFPVNQVDELFYYYNNKSVYISASVKNGLRVTEYDAENGLLKHDSTLHFQHPDKGSGMMVKIKNGKAFVLIPNNFEEKTNLFYIFDMSNGNKLYSGKIIQDGGGDQWKFIQAVNFTIN